MSMTERKRIMIKNSKVADLALILTAIIWGTGFIGTEVAIETGARTSLIIAMRFLIAGLILGVIYFKDIKQMDKKTFISGIILGVMLFAGFYCQTLGQSQTTVSNSSFLTSTNVVMVPFVVWILTKKLPRVKFFVLAFTTLIGIGILTINVSQGISFNKGDIFVLISAVCFAIHIAYLGTATKGMNTKNLTFLQMAVTGILAFVFMISFDRGAFDVDIVKNVFPATLFLAILCSCVCYYLQTTAQQYTSPSKVAIFLSMEGFFGSLFAVILGYDSLTTNLVIGGIIIISSVILSEVDLVKK